MTQRSRREFLRMFGCAAAYSALSGCAGGRWGRGYRSTKPNIVFILADDQGWHQLGCYGSSFYETPNIDRLAAEGMKFTDAYAAGPVCSPTRASILTGKYPARLHITTAIKTSNPQDKKLLVPKVSSQLPLEEVTIAEALKSVGYVTGHFGKWHLNEDKDYELGRLGDPASQGFDCVLTTHKPQKGLESPYEDDWHHVRQITERALAFIEENKNRPFFCYIPHNTIHRPQIERPELIAKYEAKPGADDDMNHPVLGAMMETLDKSVGCVLDKLNELNIADNTIVIYFADNGALGTQDRLKPLRGAKASVLEGGIRVPMLVRWPGVVRPQTICQIPVISNDFFPTLLEVVGLQVTDATVDGESLIPLLRQTGSLKRDALFWHFPHYVRRYPHPAGAVRAGRYKLIEWYEKSIDGVHVDDAVELYDLENDIGEQHDLAREMPQLAADLYVRLKNWRMSVGAQEMARNPRWEPPAER